MVGDCVLFLLLDSFNQKGSLNTHQRSHTGEQPFECNVCHKRFSHKGNLTTHVRSHTGEQPYGCEYCDKRFNQKANLNIHLRKHTGKYGGEKVL